MLPIVSRRAPPTGHLSLSMVSAFWWSQKSRMLLLMSKTASIPVERRDSDSDAIAAYTAGKEGGGRVCESNCAAKEGRIGSLWRTQRKMLASRLAHIAMRT